MARLLAFHSHPEVRLHHTLKYVFVSVFRLGLVILRK